MMTTVTIIINYCIINGSNIKITYIRYKLLLFRRKLKSLFQVSMLKIINTSLIICYNGLITPVNYLPHNCANDKTIFINAV